MNYTLKWRQHAAPSVINVKSEQSVVVSEPLGAASEQVGEVREGTPASEALKLKLKGGRKVSQAQDTRRGSYNSNPGRGQRPWSGRERGGLPQPVRLESREPGGGLCSV